MFNSLTHDDEADFFGLPGGGDGPELSDFASELIGFFTVSEADEPYIEAEVRAL